MCIRSGCFAKLLSYRLFRDFFHCALRVTWGRRKGGMSHRVACAWSHVHVDFGPVALCNPVALYLLQ